MLCGSPTPKRENPNKYLNYSYTTIDPTIQVAIPWFHMHYFCLTCPNKGSGSSVRIYKNVRIHEKFPRKCQGKWNQWLRFTLMCRTQTSKLIWTIHFISLFQDLFWEICLTIYLWRFCWEVDNFFFHSIDI